MANALADSTSPYLRQHATHPVEWLPWSEQAMTRASELDRPLLISIGYASCHWCQTMARESFDDPQVAAAMNESLVCVKVDRAEHPDVDAHYLEACQLLTGHGGWPLQVFATPDGRPFFAGTYFPPTAADGMPAWQQVVEAVRLMWHDRRDELEEHASLLADRLGGAAELEPGPLPGADALSAAVAGLRQRFDSVSGGFGGAPKFPPSTALGFLHQQGERPMVRYTLASMASGGIFDQLAGGFARYAVDASWTVPHFEKLLPDNALLARRYAEAAQATGDPAFAATAQATLDWVLRDLQHDDGGLASGLAAGTGGVDGAPYLWTVEQVRAALSPGDVDEAIAWFGLTEDGNSGVSGANVLEVRGAEPDEVVARRIRSQLLAARGARPQPERDDQRVVSWNALAIGALATAGRALARPDYTAAAERLADLILTSAQDARGRVLRLIPFPGAAMSPTPPGGTLDDHAHLLDALVTLHDATGHDRWLAAAMTLADVLVRDFTDPVRGGFFTTADDHAPALTRRKELADAPLPSGQASAARGLVRLHALTGDEDLLAAAEDVLRLGARLAVEHPTSHGELLAALADHAAGRSPASRR